MTSARALGLPRYAVFAAVLSAAGLPIYIHAPKFYVDNYGVSLGALATVLFLLRLIDVIQDPFFGWLSEAGRKYRPSLVALGGIVMAISMWGLFAVTPPIDAIWWFALTLAGLFSGFSLLTISFYAQGVLKADMMGDGHVRLATWRETGALIGVCVASVAPVALAFSGAPFVAYAGLFSALTLMALWLMRNEWRSEATAPSTPMGDILRDATARRLLLIALLNAAPVAVTSTLFLFFVESRLDAPGMEGPLLLLFFLAAALSAPAWGRLAERYGPKPMLLAGMMLAIATFGFALTLGTGDTALFAVICVASGATLGADLTLLPAIFARHMAKIAPNAGNGFGLWSFVSKFTLAIAAITLLPILEVNGFQAGMTNTPDALMTLTLLYAGLPCILKLFALTLLSVTRLTEK